MGKASRNAPPTDRPWKTPIATLTFFLESASLRVVHTTGAGDAEVLRAPRGGRAVRDVRLADWRHAGRAPVDEVREVEPADGSGTGGRLQQVGRGEAESGPCHQRLAATDVGEGGEEADAEEGEQLVHRLHPPAQRDRRRARRGAAVGVHYQPHEVLHVHGVEAEGDKVEPVGEDGPAVRRRRPHGRHGSAALAARGNQLIGLALPRKRRTVAGRRRRRQLGGGGGRTGDNEKREPH